MDTPCRFSEKNTAEVLRVVLATYGFAADTEIHDTAVTGLLDEMLNHPGGKEHIWRLLDLVANWDHPVLGQAVQFIAFHVLLLNHFGDELYLCWVPFRKSSRKKFLVKIYLPKTLVRGYLLYLQVRLSLAPLKSIISTLSMCPFFLDLNIKLPNQCRLRL